MLSQRDVALRILQSILEFECIHPGSASSSADEVRRFRRFVVDRALMVHIGIYDDASIEFVCKILPPLSIHGEYSDEQIRDFTHLLRVHLDWSHRPEL